MKVFLIVKRFFDIIFSIVLLILVTPFLLFFIMLLKVVSIKESPFFKQVRCGYKCEEFIIYKLRSMTNEKDNNGNLLSDKERTKLWGKIIRKLNIDEIPQVINIFKGEMSLIGPRPLTPKFINSLSEEKKRRQNVKPGITGWEAVNERITPTREMKIEFDLFYVDNFSFSLDFKIFFKTVYLVLFAQRPSEEYRNGTVEINKNNKI